jgi:hypothetical protein
MAIRGLGILVAAALFLAARNTPADLAVDPSQAGIKRLLVLILSFPFSSEVTK